MTATDLIQTFSFFACILTVVVWLLVGNHNQRLVYLRWVVIIPSFLTALFYAVVLLSNFNENNPEIAALLSALLRMYTQLLFLIGGLVMLRSFRKSEKP